VSLLAQARSGSYEVAHSCPLTAGGANGHVRVVYPPGSTVARDACRRSTPPADLHLLAEKEFTT
jgi:hypothetical protein